jgi:3-methylcrotonyl-CoA carboxylase alpha subunit
MKNVRYTLAGEEREASVERTGATAAVTHGESSRELGIESISSNELVVTIDGRRSIVPFLRRGDMIDFHYEGDVWSLELPNASKPRRGKSRDHSMSAPMPGVVLKIFVSKGDVVAQGTPLIILEAMKMEHGIHAPYAGSVRSINCSVGDLVQPGVDLIDLAPEETK